MTADVGANPLTVAVLAQKLADLEKRFAEAEKRHNISDNPTPVPSPELPAAADEQVQATRAKPLVVTTEKQEEGEKKDEEGQPPSRVKVIISKKDEDGTPMESAEKQPVFKNENDSAYALVLKKNIHHKFSAAINNSQIDITSPDLWRLLKTHLGNYPYHMFRGQPVTLKSPYQAIVFKWDELQEATTEVVGKEDELAEARKDLKVLLDTISGGSSGDESLDKYFKIRDSYKNQETETVQFTDLWTIFPPGTLVYGKPFQNQDQVFVVKDNYAPWPRTGRSGILEPWRLNAWSYDWKDGSFRRCCFTLIFEPFEGHLPITSLPYFPFAALPSHKEVEANLITRGKAFRRQCEAKEGSRLFEYSGDAISEKRGFSGMVNDDEESNDIDPRLRSPDLAERAGFVRKKTREDAVAAAVVSTKVAGRVMVDYASYFQYGVAYGRNGSLEPSIMLSECNCTDCLGNVGLMKDYRTLFDKWGTYRKWDDEQYLLCPPRVLGYVLLEKQWAQLQVTSLSQITEHDPKKAWDSRLKLKNEKVTKELLFDLVTSHRFSHATNEEDDESGLEVDDIIPRKGKGLVILLYGPPGVGKTLTVETIAEATRKPLFSVSVADVGTKAKHVEANLAKIFSLATSWQAILLIDEADVFLESRGRGPNTYSTDKNALVSVFLRVLEYYQGIMFLTTNQIADFDVAIVSRIHVAVQYESLSRDQMDAIFTGFLDKLDDQGLIEDYDGIKEWLREDVFTEGFDGRQIRNIVTTALGLARAEKTRAGGMGKLTKKHIKKTFSNVRSFKGDFRVQMEQYKQSQLKMIR